MNTPGIHPQLRLILDGSIMSSVDAPEPIISTGLCTPERAVAIKRAAQDLRGVLPIKATSFDLAIPEKAAEFATLVSHNEAHFGFVPQGEDGKPNLPRTVKQVIGDVVLFSQAKGLQGLAVEAANADIPTDALWILADEYSAQQS